MMLRSVLLRLRCAPATSHLGDKLVAFSTLVTEKRHMEHHLSTQQNDNYSLLGIDTKAYDSRKFLPQVKLGDSVKAKITKRTNLGANVEVMIGNRKASGFVVAHEVDLFTEKLNGKEITAGQTFDAFVMKVKEDGFLDISFRPQGIKRLVDVQDQVLNAIKQSPTGVLPIGDKSPVSDIALMFRGVSKHDFKAAVGRLYKEGLVKPGPHSIAFMTDEERKVETVHELAHLEKTHFKPVVPYSTIFLGNLPVQATDSQVLAAVEEEVGFDTVHEVRLVVNEVTGRSKGYAFVDFKSERDVLYAIRKLRRAYVFGKRLKVGRSTRKVTAIKVTSDTPGSYPIVPPKPEKPSVEELLGLSAGAASPQYEQLTSGVYDINDRLLSARQQQRTTQTPSHQQQLDQREQYLQLPNGHYNDDENDYHHYQDGDEEVGGTFTGDFALDPNFDPETEYYVLDDDGNVGREAGGYADEYGEEQQHAGEEEEEFDDIELYKREAPVPAIAGISRMASDTAAQQPPRQQDSTSVGPGRGNSSGDRQSNGRRRRW